MSEERHVFFESTFNRSVKVRARDQRLSSNGGVLLLRETDARLGLIDSVASQLRDRRRQDRIRYHLDELLRERIFSLALGYSADDDVDLLAHDPAMRIATWNRAGEAVLEERMASQPTQSRLTDNLTVFKSNVEAVRAALADWVERHLRASGQDRSVQRATLDIDSFPIEVHGDQEGGAYHGYYQKKVYHPIVAGVRSGRRLRQPSAWRRIRSRGAASRKRPHRKRRRAVYPRSGKTYRTFLAIGRRPPRRRVHRRKSPRRTE